MPSLRPEIGKKTLTCLRVLLPVVLLSWPRHAFPQARTVNGTIDVSKTGAPISKNIYGQFLEHGGDIVNTGVWSEMLVDRKFFYPVEAAAPTPPPVMGNAGGNPRFNRKPTRWWAPIGRDGDVTMDTNSPHTGDHTPLVKLGAKDPHGFGQSGIAVRKGKTYTGRIVLAGSPGAGPYTTATELDVDKAALHASDPLVEPASTSLSTFAFNGGKLIFFHGDSDPWFSSLDTLGNYKSLAETNGGTAKVAEWSRIFLVPGMAHCGGGPSLDHFDMLSAVVDWVEKGKAPDAVIATGNAFPGRSRPLCAYPKHAQYTGSGDSQDARNFRCQ